MFAGFFLLAKFHIQELLRSCINYYSYPSFSLPVPLYSD